ncbi:DUF5655 domain-containing protein [Hydrotalea sandarakina]|jgi:predicted transport protein|uniref:Putative transport protein n=1 Tax=Hydrotalea sandarakina TaxID=1004304 RepID=A0A2W7RMA3_9BACT|nr:DUF5655 domain-containing protein [Hydrotalea sandarakina]PZX61948.1 putative transport protein [Hydrotalea sandarakina]
MVLFNIDNKDQLCHIKELPFKLEKEIQTITEQNLTTIFGLDFVRSEFSLGNFRIDTLAFDKDTSSFVIIEYKRDKNFSVIDQGYAYLSLMLNNKADFILEYNENNNSTLKRDDVDWSQSRVIFISPSFTTYQKEAINFKDLPIELWEVKRYENKTISYNQIQTSGSQESVKTISRKDDAIEKVTQEIKVFTEEEHLEGMPDEIKELYEKFKNAILNLDSLEVKPKKLYIAFVASTNVVDIRLQKNGLKMWLNLERGHLDDPKGICRDVSQTGHWGNGDYELQVNSDDNLEYILSLIRQSLKRNKK